MFLSIDKRHLPITITDHRPMGKPQCLRAFSLELSLTPARSIDHGVYNERDFNVV